MSSAQASDGETVTVAPIVLAPNRPAERPYRGGEGILRFRGIPVTDEPAAEWMPEDFVASTTEVFAGGGVGLTVLPNGTSLRAEVAAHPDDYLGDAHVRAFGADPMLLVKLLDTRQRLFVHYHPTTAFARGVLAHPRGKTEAWVVVAVDGPAFAHLGFSRDVSEAEVLDWFERQDVDGMLAALHRVELSVGDTLYVPAGMPHSIGEGITLVELQQPVDLSIVLEHDGFPAIDVAASLLGLDVATALSNLDRSAVSPKRLAELASSRAARWSGGSQTTDLFPEEADSYFRAVRIAVAGQCRLEQAFAVLIVLDGEGALEWNDDAVVLSKGQTVLLPYAAGETTLRGVLTVLWCRPPAA